MNERNAEFVSLDIEGGVGGVEFPSKVSAVMDMIQDGMKHMPTDYAFDLAEVLKEDANKYAWPPFLFSATVLWFNNLADILKVPEESITSAVQAVVRHYGPISKDGMTEEQRKKGDQLMIGANDNGFWTKEVEDGESSDP